MLIKDVEVNTRGSTEDSIDVILVFEKEERTTIIEGGREIKTKHPKTNTSVTKLNTNSYYLVLDGSISIKKGDDPTANINADYQSSEFIDYNDLWSPWQDQEITIVMQKDSKLLSFCIDDPSAPRASSVKALTINNSSIDINTVDDSFIIVLGEHTMNGAASDEKRVFTGYKIGGPKAAIDSPFYTEVAPGTMTITANGTCNIINIKK